VPNKENLTGKASENPGKSKKIVNKCPGSSLRFAPTQVGARRYIFSAEKPGFSKKNRLLQSSSFYQPFAQGQQEENRLYICMRYTRMRL